MSNILVLAGPARRKQREGEMSSTIVKEVRSSEVTRPTRPEKYFRTIAKEVRRWVNTSLTQVPTYKTLGLKTESSANQKEVSVLDLIKDNQEKRGLPGGFRSYPVVEERRNRKRRGKKKKKSISETR